MKAETAYQFLKPSLDQMDEQEREKLSHLIFPLSDKAKKLKRKHDPIMSVEQMKRKLIRFHFKSRN